MRGPYLALIKLKKGDFKYYIILGYYHNKILWSSFCNCLSPGNHRTKL